MQQENNVLTAGATSVQQIVELALAAHLDPASDIPAAVLPAGASVQSLEHLDDAPNRMRATYETERISDFCHYVEHERDENTAVFVDARGSGANAIIDYGTDDAPKWGEHHATLTMRPTPEFEALRQAVKKPKHQRSLVEFIEDWRPFIQPYAMSDGEDEADAATDLNTGTALARIRKIDIKRLLDNAHEDQEFSARKSTLASVEAVSGGQKPPAGFRFVCKPYPECAERTIDVRLSIRTTSDEPSFTMRIVGEKSLDYEIAEEIELDITSRLDGTRVFVGSAQLHHR